MGKGRFVYVIGPRTGPYKIGIAGNVNIRRSVANVGNPQYLFVHYQLQAEDTDEAKSIEREAHYHFAERHIRGEWFSLAPDDLPVVRQVICNARIVKCAPDGWA